MLVTFTDLNICTESCSHRIWLESKKGEQFYTVLQRKLIKPLMLKYLWVSWHLKKNQGPSASSSGDRKSSQKGLSKEFQNLYVLFNLHSFSLATCSPCKWFFSPFAVYTLISSLALPLGDHLAQKHKLQNINCIPHTFLRCEIFPCVRLYLIRNVNGADTCECHLPRQEFCTQQMQTHLISEGKVL